MSRVPLQSFLFAAVLLVTIMVRSHMDAAGTAPSAVSTVLAESASLEAAPPPAEQTPITIPTSRTAALEPPAISAPPAETSRAPLAAREGKGATVTPTNVLNVPPEEKKSARHDAPISASIALVKDLTSGETYVAREPEKRWAIASLTKLITAVVIAEAWDADKKIIVTARALAAEGDAGGLAAGEIYTVRDMLSLMLLTSSNDAANALADAYGERALVSAMQEKVRAIGMADTAVADATGISYLNQSTARDLELLARYLVAHHPELLELTAKGRARVTDESRGVSRTLTSIHPFAGRPHFFGGKTGYTDEARGNLFSLFQWDNRIVFILVLGSADRARDTQLLYGALTGS